MHLEYERDRFLKRTVRRSEVLQLEYYIGSGLQLISTRSSYSIHLLGTEKLSLTPHWWRLVAELISIFYERH